MFCRSRVTSLAILLTAALSLPAVGCGKDADENQNQNQNQATNQNAGENQNQNQAANQNQNQTTNQNAGENQNQNQNQNQNPEEPELLPFDPDTSPEDGLDFSSPQILVSSLFAPNLALIPFDSEEDPDCPIVLGTSIGGECTDIHGRTIRGSLTSEIAAGANEYFFLFPPSPSDTLSITEMDLTIDNLSITQTEKCPADETIEAEVFQSFHGAISFKAVDDENLAFDIDFLTEGIEFDEDADDCSTFTSTAHVQYSGTITIVDSEFNEETEEEEITHHIWSGSGTITYGDRGYVEVATEEEVIHLDECEFEPLSGTTSITFADDTVEYRYDGATDCDEDATVSWYIDDEKQGEVTGAFCTMAPGAPSTAGLAIIMLMLLRLSTRRQEKARA